MIRRICLIACSVLCCQTFADMPVCGAGLQPGPFSAAIELAQQKTVKIFGATVGKVKGYGTGIVVSGDGKILTGYGVYLTGSRVRVGLPDGAIHDARVLKRDPALQLALLQIDAETPEFFELSEKPIGEKGDWIVTVSNAFRVADRDEPLSVNLGVLSLRTSISARRTSRDIEYEGELVLIDAITSNPGAAGGAVVNVDGDLVGMIGRVIESSETNTRLNYAVPADLLRRFVVGQATKRVATIPTTNRGEKGELGIRLFRLGGSLGPAYIDRVERGSPASLAKLRPDDLIVSIGGNKIATIRDYAAAEEQLVAGEEVIIVVKRGRDLHRIALTPDAKK